MPIMDRIQRALTLQPLTVVELARMVHASEQRARDCLFALRDAGIATTGAITTRRGKSGPYPRQWLCINPEGGRPVTAAQRIIVALKKAPMTAEQLSATVHSDLENVRICLRTLAKNGMIRVHGFEAKGNPGRPRTIYAIEDTFARDNEVAA